MRTPSELILQWHIDGSKFKAVNNRDNTFTVNKVKRRRE
jgi:hypothetical protein